MTWWTRLTPLIVIAVLAVACGGDEAKSTPTAVAESGAPATEVTVNSIRYTKKTCAWEPDDSGALALKFDLNVHNRSGKRQTVDFAFRDREGNQHAAEHSIGTGLRTPTLMSGEILRYTVTGTDIPVGADGVELVLFQNAEIAGTMALGECAVPSDGQ